LKLALILLSVCIGFTMTSITQAADPYRAVIAGQEERVLRFLRTYETFQEELRMDQAGAQRKALFHALDTIVTELRTELYELSVPAELIEFNTRWRKILSHFDNAYMAIMTSTKEQFLQAFLRGGREFSHASYLLYALRAELPQVQQYWQLANAEMQRPIPETVNSVASI